AHETAKRESARCAPRIKSNKESPAIQAHNRSWHQFATSVQAKLRVSYQDDACEQEADKVADRVVSMSEPEVQRYCAKCANDGATCSHCQADLLRQADSEWEEPESDITSIEEDEDQYDE